MRLNDIVSFNSEFRNAVNLYLNLNKLDKVKSYIPTKSSVDIIKRYLDAVECNKNQSSILIGPYGKGKSHLLLVLLAIISLDRKDKNNCKLIQDLVDRIKKVDDETAKLINNIWDKKGRFLPIIIMSTQGDLNQAFLVGLNEALKRDGLTELVPDTFFSHAVEVIKRWKKEFTDTYDEYKRLLKKRKISENDMLNGLVNCDSNKLDIFKSIYPELTSGGVFNPLASSEVLPMYKSVAEKLKEEYGYSGVYIVFDEFSKFIEGQDKKLAGNNMKLLQDVCELANDSKDAQVFITMVAHKSIKEYGKYLSVDTINSFTGIEGRIEEVKFITSSKNNYELIKNAIYKDEDKLESYSEVSRYVNSKAVDKYYELESFKTFFTKDDFEKIVVKGCYPLSPASAYLLLNISEKVAQNERTLFTFISKDEQYSMARYVKNHKVNDKWIVNADLIYDYFKSIFKKDIANEYVHNEWLNAEYAISKTKDKVEISILKTLALINVVNKPDELPANLKYLELVSGVEDADLVINKLVNDGLIYKKDANACYVFKTRATSEIKTEIKNRVAIKGERVNVGKVLSDISDNKYLLPKRYNYEYSMTRYFRHIFMDVEEFLEVEDSRVFFDCNNFCDGIMLSLFSLNGKSKLSTIKDKLKKFECDNLLVNYNENEFTLLKQVQEYDVIQELKHDAKFFDSENKKILLKELPIIEDDLRTVIYEYIDRFYGEEQNKLIYFVNNSVKIEENVRFSKVIDDICYRIYDKAVVVNNELINKEYVNTAPIKKARKEIMDRLLNCDNVEDYMKGTSAEATIYRALFVGTGIHYGRLEKNVENMLGVVDEYLDTCGKRKETIDVLIKKLTEKPIGMRKGIIPIYLSYALSRRNEDIIVYFDRKEVELTTDIILNMCDKPKDYYIYISTEDINKEKYLSNLGELFNVQINDSQRESRINRIFSSMQRWFRALPQVTKNIKRQDKYISNKVVESAFIKIKSLLQSVEVNSYEALFVEIPRALNCDENYEEAYNNLSYMKEKLDKYYEWITLNAANETIKVFSMGNNQDLCHTLYEWYEKQSNLAKKGLYSSNITGLMQFIEKNKNFDDAEVVKKVVKIVTGVYIDSWNDTSLEKYLEQLRELKSQIEDIHDSVDNEGQLELSFVNNEGVTVTRFYNRVDENTGVILRNMLSDTLEDHSDLTANEKVAILLEMIEKVLD